MGYGRLQHPSLIPTPELSVSGSRGLSRKTRNSQAPGPPPRVNSSIVQERIYCQTAPGGPEQDLLTGILFLVSMHGSWYDDHVRK